MTVAVSATLIGVCAAPATAAPPGSAGGPLPPGGTERPLLQQALDTVPGYGVPGALTVVDDDLGHWSGGSGVGDVATGQAVRPDGRFRAGSITKTFVATVVLQLVDEGRIGLDDPIADHLPGLLPYPQPITVRQLLQHTSGLPRDARYWTDLAGIDTERWRHHEPAELIAEATREPLVFEPGTGWAYSNIGYQVLGLLVEEVTGRPLSTELNRRIVHPLRLRGTYLPDRLPLVLSPAMRGYEALHPPGTALTDVTEYDMSWIWAAGALVTTGDDLNRFYDALLGGELLSEEALDQMRTTVPMQEGSPAGYGLGLMALPIDCGTRQSVLWGHNGGVPGFLSYSLVDEADGQRLTIAMNQALTAPVETGYGVNNVLGAVFCDLDAPGGPGAGPASPPNAEGRPFTAALPDGLTDVLPDAPVRPGTAAPTPTD
ncbi:D-alanyl-D-alanine carboxypeptidase [Allostreptomyces psammosilenae]|uniref:D-alanyl-D-alanine carboxypeptidase n=1 Tax=Allostreptomyces psammosilenae TaxID=1892865 RepID=A0A853A2M3_9ACTN|nr:D-alanyl-D-alanine carboxypeptidase [Allostreptomyces psammosilenae]